MHTKIHTRTKAMAVIGAVAALAGINAAAAGAAVGGAPAIPLNVGQETTGSNTGAHGFFSYTIDGDQLCYTLSVQDLSVPAAAAHIHWAPRNVAGAIVVPLTVVHATTWTNSACTTADAALLGAIAADPGAYYVNVHTATFPGGEIRGQLK